ncbi:hypothetical protein GKE82_00080 [Conexibacter sp. W3-3-2]|uniref:hypothetical protein n=1 Tax=Conexibacter sp. W3-3-2 TaxID=2675227 RepID=UPI0012B713E2|nr:hypothetical protein [Conexibacter sp. W3-3-2]MTD42741.1 hypothetical protein [Conexibacter sp. W3-3-2]
MTIRNFQNLRGGDSSIVVDKGTQNTTIVNGTCADPTTPSSRSASASSRRRPT